MRIRSALYWLARRLGDLEALRRGPRAVGRRVVNRWLGRRLGRLFLR